MYTDIATLKRNVAENVILWSKRTHLSFEAFVSKPSSDLKTVVNIRKLNNWVYWECVFFVFVFVFLLFISIRQVRDWWALKNWGMEGYVQTIPNSLISMPKRKAIRYSMKTFPICDSPLKRSARRSFTPLQKPRRNRRSYVWTEAPSVIFVLAQKLAGIMWT